MATINRINPNNRNIVPGVGQENNIFVKSGDVNPLIDQVNTNTTAIAAIIGGTASTVAQLRTGTSNTTFVSPKTIADEGLIFGNGTMAFTGTVTNTGTVNATTFDTNVAAAAVTLAGTTLAADGTDAAIGITITPKGAASVKLPNGTAANPALIGTTSSGAGIHFGSNTVSIDTAGTERIIFDAQGDININGGAGIEGGTTGVLGYWAGFMPIAVQEAKSGPGAISIATYYTALTTTGTGDALTLATGKVIGQLKKIKYVAEGAGADTAVLTPSVTTGFSTCTFNAVGDYAVFAYNGTYWVCIENFGCTLA